MKSSNSTSGLFAGSHARNELHVLHGTDQDQHNRDSSSTRESATKTCRVCGDEIGLKENGERFVACGECGFPVCRPCYEYERSEGNQSCPQCHTRYKRHKGCLRVEGDDEENFDDDFEDEFRLKNHHANHVSHHHDSEHGDYNQNQNHPNGVPVTSVAGSVAGKDFDGEKEAYNNEEWKERVEKWKTRQEKRGLFTKADDGKRDQDDDEDFLLLPLNGGTELQQRLRWAVAQARFSN